MEVERKKEEEGKKRKERDRGKHLPLPLSPDAVKGGRRRWMEGREIGRDRTNKRTQWRGRRGKWKGGNKAEGGKREKRSAREGGEWKQRRNQKYPLV